MRCGSRAARCECVLRDPIAESVTSWMYGMVWIKGDAKAKKYQNMAHHIEVMDATAEGMIALGRCWISVVQAILGMILSIYVDAP